MRPWAIGHPKRFILGLPRGKSSFWNKGFNMDRAEIVDCEPNGEAVFSAIIYKIAFWVKMAKMTVDEIKQAGIQCTINKPSICLNNGETFALLTLER